MLKILLSPSKTMDFSAPCLVKNYTIPAFIKESQELIDILKELSEKDLIHLMKISPALASLNRKRFRQWKFPYPEASARRAIFAFKGDVYEGLRADKFTVSDLDFAMKSVRILSGLYGLLRPLDLIMPYRLEMGIKLENPYGRTLYKFWGSKPTDEINKSAKETGATHIINLASTEYFKAVIPKKLKQPIITPVFMERKNGSFEVVGIHAKRARGLMTRFIVTNRITRPDDLKNFSDEHYFFNPDISDESTWAFTREKK